MASLRVTSALLLAFVTLSCLPTTLSFFHEWGPDLEGPWCATRPRGTDCCDGRDDYCAVPILGTECYCDIFCNETAYDCCPDFWAHCYGVTRPPTTARPTTMPPPRTSPSPIIRCELNGRYYNPGETVVDNCNKCTCQLYASEGRRTYSMRCSNDVCLIRPELIRDINNGRFTWHAANHSNLWGMTLSEGVRYRLGTYPLEPDVVVMTPIKVRQDEALPERFDARDKWSNMLHPIRDQGNCASSWAFSTTAVASDRLTIESAGAIREELSAQHMLSCDTDGQDGCTGGEADRAWFFLRKHGVVTEGCYPYDSGTKSVQGQCLLSIRQRGGDCPSGIEYKRDKRYKAAPPYRIRPLEREIMKEIMDNGPVQAIFEVKEDFYMYSSGVYQYSGFTRNERPEARKSAYHSVRLIGWGVDRTPEGNIIKYWIGANSWGPEWGENGYFRIIRGVNANDIETNIIGAWGKISGDIAQRRLLVESRRRRLQARRERVPGLRRLRQLTRRRRRRHHHTNKGVKQLRSLEPRRGRRHRDRSARRERRQRKGGRRINNKKGNKGKKTKKGNKGKKTKKTNNHKKSKPNKSSSRRNRKHTRKNSRRGSVVIEPLESDYTKPLEDIIGTL